MKKTPLLLLLAMCLVAAGCSSSGSSSPGEPSQSSSETASPQATRVPAPTAGPTATAEPTPVPEPVWVTGSSDYIFDQATLHTYDITISEENLAIIDADPAAEEYVEAELSFEGETIGTVGMRYKGSVGAFVGCLDGPLFNPSGPKNCTKLSFKLKVNWDNTDDKFYGLKKLQFHASNGDASLMRERLGYHLFREMGVPGPRAVHARININGEFNGVYVMVEQIDGRFARENFEDGTGNVYKEVWPINPFGTLTDDTEIFAGLKTNEDENPSYEIFQTFGQELLDADEADVPAVLDKWLDMDIMMAYTAVDRTIHHDDGPFHFYCFGGAFCAPHNYYWIEEPTLQKLYLIPWDLDYAFENIQGDRNPVTPIADDWGEISNDCEPFVNGSFGLEQKSATCDTLVAGLVTFQAEYEQAVADFKAGALSEGNITELFEAWTAQIEPAMAEANELHSAASVTAWQRAVDALADDLAYAAAN